MQQLFVFSGVPASGKSTLAKALARHLKIPYFSRDHFQGFLYERDLIDENTIDGYYWLLEQARLQLSLGVSCILDGVFGKQNFRNILMHYVRNNDALFCPVHCCCSDVVLWQKRWQARAKSGHEAHWMDFSWADVERIRQDFEPWSHPNLIILDSAQPYDCNLQHLFQQVSELNTS